MLYFRIIERQSDLACEQGQVLNIARLFEGNYPYDYSWWSAGLIWHVNRDRL